MTDTLEKTFTEGDRVLVSADAKTVKGGGVYYGTEVEAEVIEVRGIDNNVLVRTDTLAGGVREQYVAPKYLTLVKESEKPAGFSVGDRVRVARGPVASLVGLECEILRVNANRDSDFFLKPLADRADTGGGHDFYYPPAHLDPVTVTEEAKPLDKANLPTGTKIRITGDATRHLFPIGTIVQVVRAEGRTWVTASNSSSPVTGDEQWTYAEDRSLTPGRTYVRSVNVEDFEVVEEEKSAFPILPADDLPTRAALEEAETRAKGAELRAESAEKALAAFRERVREAVIDEAEEREWCDEVDDWLERLGLEPRDNRAADAEQGSVALLTDGRIAIKKDGDSQGWRVFRGGSDEGRWWYDREISPEICDFLYEP